MVSPEALGLVIGRRAGLAIALAAASLATPALAQSAAPEIASGNYGGELLIGFDPATRTVSGYFQSSTGGGKFSCIFYLAGKLRDGTAPIRTFFPAAPAEAIDGTLTREDRTNLHIALPQEHGGCWNVQHFADKDQPAAFGLQAAYPWISIAVVKSDKAYFFDAPAARTHRRSYLIKGDGIGVRAIRDGWLQVDFTGGAKPASGWIRQADVYPAR